MIQYINPTTLEWLDDIMPDMTFKMYINQVKNEIILTYITP